MSLPLWILLAALLAPEAKANELRLQLSWKPVGNFAGYYAAVADGHYTREKLKARLMHGGRGINTIDRVVSGQADMGLAEPSQIILARADGAPVRAVAALYQRSPIVFFTLASSGIDKPDQFVGKKIRVTRSLIPALHAMMRRLGHGPETYELADLPSDPALVLKGDVPVWGAHISGLAATMRQKGHDLNLFFPADYGASAYSQVIFTTDAYLAANAEKISRFLQASFAGLRAVLAMPRRVDDLIVIHDPKADIIKQRNRLISITPLVIRADDRIGWMTADNWRRIIGTMVTLKQLPGPLPVKDVISMVPLHGVYGTNN